MIKSLPYVLLAIVTFASGFFIEQVRPWADKWLRYKIETLSREKLPLRLKMADVQVGFFPPSVEVFGIDFEPTGELAKSLARGSIQRVKASLSWLEFLKGHIRVAQIEIVEPQITIILKKPKKEIEWPKLDLLKILSQVPVNEVKLEKLKMLFSSEEAGLSGKSEQVDLVVENMYRALYVSLSAPKTVLKQKEEEEKISLAVETRLLLEEDALNVSALKVKKGQSFLVGSGRILGRLLEGEFGQMQVQTRGNLKLKEISDWISEVKPEYHPPPMEGQVEIEINAFKEESKQPQYKVSFKGKDVKVSKYKIGEVVALASLENKGKEKAFPSLHFERLRAFHEGVDVNIPSANIELGGNFETQLNLNLERMELAEFLTSIGVKRPPLVAHLKGSANCSGTLKPFLLQCSPRVRLDHFDVWGGGEKKKMIAELRDVEATGTTKIDLKEVTYEGRVNAGKSTTGKSSGTIKYDEGFFISYEGDKLDFGDVKNLADLKVEGVAKVKGTTQGNSHTATFQMLLEGKGVWFENFELGEVKTTLSYEKGDLSFKELSGVVGTTRYSSDVVVNVRESSIRIKARSPFLNAADLQRVFARKVLLPFSVSGSGSAQLEGHGPLKLSRLNYQLKSALFRGTIAGEDYDQVQFNVRSIRGNVKAEGISLTRGRSLLNAIGGVKSDGQVDLQMEGRKFRVEESKNVSQLGLDLSGELNFNVGLSGPILDPEAVIEGRLRQVMVRDQLTTDSRFTLNVNKKYMGGEAYVFGDKIQTKFQIPYKTEDPFRFDLKVNRWDFAEVFSLFSEGQTYKQFETELSGKASLFADKGGFWASSGLIQVDQIEIARGPIELRNSAPMKIWLTDGSWSSENFTIRSKKNFLALNLKNSRRDDFKASLNARLDLSIVALFTPFLQDLRGRLEGSVQTSGPISELAMLGNAELTGGFVKIPGFPHPFENIESRILLSRNKVTFQSVKSRLAGGQINGTGEVSIEKDKVPIFLRASFHDVQLNIPDQVRTRGSGNLTLEGERFPYLLKGKYEIARGEVTREFEESKEADRAQKVRPSPYLPRESVASENASLKFDIEAVIRNEVLVQNSTVEGGVLGSLRIQGSPDQPELFGTLVVSNGTKVFFRETTFETIAANVQFQGPASEPIIYLSARSRVNEYDINLLFQGNPKRPQISLSSNPPLPEREIISLLAFGVISNQQVNSQAPAGQNTGTEKTSQTGYQIGSALLSRLPLGKEIKNRFGAEVQFSSTYDNNDRNGVAQPALSVKKELTTNVNARYTKTFGKRSSSDYKLEYRFSPRLFLIGGYEKREYQSIESTLQRNESSDIFGLDLEYKVEFR